MHRQSKLHDQLKSYLILPLKPFSHCRLTLDLEIFARLCKIVFKLERRPGWRLTSQQNQIQCILKFFQTVHLSGALSFGRRYGQRIWPCASLGTCAATHRTGLVISSQLSQNWMGQFTWLQPYDLHGQKQVKIPWFPVFRFSQQSSSINDKIFSSFPRTMARATQWIASTRRCAFATTQKQWNECLDRRFHREIFSVISKKHMVGKLGHEIGQKNVLQIGTHTHIYIYTHIHI